MTGAIAGVGTANRGAAVDWRIFARLVVAWIVTIPAAALVAALAFLLTTAPPAPVAAVLTTALLAAVIGGALLSLRRSPRAADFDHDAADERLVGLRPGAGSVIDTEVAPARERALTGAGRATRRAEEPW